MAMSRSFGATELTSVPSMRISPSLTLSRPAIIASSVDLPQPDGPTSATNSPVRASRSMPFSTSTTPKRLCSPETVSVAIAVRSFDRALGEAANEILAAEEIDQQRRHGGDQHRAAGDVVGAGVHGICGQSDKRGSHRLLTPASEDDAKQIFVPDAGELPDDGDDEDRRRKRKNDLIKDAPEPGPVDPGRFDEVVRNVHVVVAAEQRRERHALNHMDEDETVNRVGQVQRPQNERPGQQRNLAGHKNAERHADEKRLRSRKAPLRQHVAINGAEDGRNDRRRNRHDQRIVEIPLNAFAGAGDTMMQPRSRPGAQRKALRDRDQPVARNLRQFSEGIGYDHKQRYEVDQCEKAQEGVDSDAAGDEAKVRRAGVRIEGAVVGHVNHGLPPAVSATSTTARKARGRSRAPAAS